MVFNGSTSSNATSVALESSGDIVSYTIANKSGGAITASVGIFYGSSITYILYNEAIGAGETYVYLGGVVNIQSGYAVFVSVSGSADYYFTIKKPSATS
jgi:hypothetical protein